MQALDPVRKLVQQKIDEILAKHTGYKILNQISKILNSTSMAGLPEELKINELLFFKYGKPLHSVNDLS